MKRLKTNERLSLEKTTTEVLGYERAVLYYYDGYVRPGS